MSRSLRVAVVGAGPAGIYAADILTKSDAEVSIDLFERMPAPYGLIRYGVAPDHPRIKGIVNALQKVLDRPEIRFFGNVEYGVDVKLEDLRQHYDAVIFSTGAEKDRAMDVPGIELDGSYGAADFVSWYDGHPDVPRTWPLTASQVAVLGVGNVALDVARVLAKTADELLTTEIPDNVYEGLKSSPVTDVHVFGRRGPAQAKFTPLELRELDHSPNVEVIVHPEGIDFDEGSMASIRSSKQVEMVVKTLQEWALRDVGDRPRRLHLHFLEAPVEVTGEDGKVVGLRTERMELAGDGNVKGTGEFTDWPVQAVYRAVGYLSTSLVDLPFDTASGTVPHAGGRVVDLDEQPLPGVYVTGWIKRGPVGLIGHTKGDALETVTNLLADADALPACQFPEPDAIVRFLEQRAVPFTTVEGWLKLDAHEKALGAERGRERVKVVDRETMTSVSRS
ncbi:FAD-dependent oxidoreductase [Actinosynnema mirum]|uniref:ferredoxin--NADP(+) reductase n=1 Tax=Actinosynnema mirum (strain ATCC 29888 / DSM 43827 / JCM 3225 / NBRC 14064 / NCIMB 13271 / NRRL B-12336 / IMRU 3971 / 101) TaxID=446462 RepID=C6WCH2_ACTMD|nr:FAD-dependent oxidoreductase [Actinosynnema mirum]ACU33993.1 Ferredoxin--NADP(+) reductase [Actinosynnema mirum DSM 43827]